jgi:hypothetical protein
MAEPAAATPVDDDARRPRGAAAGRCRWWRIAALAASAMLILAATAGAATPGPGAAPGQPPRPAAATGVDAAAAVDVRITGDRIAADIGQVPITAVLARIARDTGATVLVRGDLGTTRPQSFANAPLLDGLERLVAPNHLVVEFGPARGGFAPRLLRIRVFGFGAASDPSPEPMALAASGGAAAVPAARIGASFDGRLGWDYDDPGRLPPLPQRVRRIGSIFPTSGDAGLQALRLVIEYDPDAQARMAAVRATGAFPSAEATPLLQQSLGDDSPEVRLAVVSVMNPPMDEPPYFLVDIITDETEDERVRMSALERLGQYRVDTQVQQFLEDIASFDDPRISGAARSMLIPR